METYYNPEDLAKFGTIGEKASELAEKFFAYYNAVFEEGMKETIVSLCNHVSAIQTCTAYFQSNPGRVSRE